MRSHSQIITDALDRQPDAVLAVRLGANSHQVRDWRLRGRIPPEWWTKLVDAGLTSLGELAEAAAAAPKGSKQDVAA